MVIHTYKLLERFCLTIYERFLLVLLLSTSFLLMLVRSPVMADSRRIQPICLLS
jgi:hypothetical protein